MKQSEQLISILREVQARYQPLNLLERQVFVQNLVFLHNVMTASENLLEVAITRASGSLLTYYQAHVEEERQHEKWLAEDLLSAGVDVLRYPISPEAVAMAGSQYYLIFHVDPVALLGYMAVLECFPLGEPQMAQLESTHGESLCRTLRYHAVHDCDHGSDVLDAIDGVTPQQFALVLDNAVQTALYVGAAISKIGRQS